METHRPLSAPFAPALCWRPLEGGGAMGNMGEGAPRFAAVAFLQPMGYNTHACPWRIAWAAGAPAP